MRRRTICARQSCLPRVVPSATVRLNFRNRGGVMLRTYAWSIAVALAAIAAPMAVAANMPAPQRFSAVQKGPDVVVCGHDIGIQCGGTPNPMVRQDTDGTQAVVLDDDCDADGCWIDRCVPAGNYSYGLQTPLPCRDSTGTMDFTTATVVAGGTCTTPSGTTPLTGALTWSSDGWVCHGSYGSGSSAGCNAGSVPSLVVLFNLVFGVAGGLLWVRSRMRRSS